MGNSTGTTSPPQTQIQAYFGYIQSLMAASSRSAGQRRHRLVQRRRRQHDQLEFRLPRAPVGQPRQRDQL